MVAKRSPISATAEHLLIFSAKQDSKQAHKKSTAIPASLPDVTNLKICFTGKLITKFIVKCLLNIPLYFNCCDLLLGEEASPNIGNTLWRDSTMFTRPVITPPEVYRFG